MAHIQSVDTIQREYTVISEKEKAMADERIQDYYDK
jgi:hypothetical protein|tara:strand:+ start:366 stop:473 length:108 start_codon:yes stop_codon:yes gene_type:complete